jgi:hypothetical protein
MTSKRYPYIAFLNVQTIQLIKYPLHLLFSPSHGIHKSYIVTKNVIITRGSRRHSHISEGMPQQIHPDCLRRRHDKEYMLLVDACSFKLRDRVVPATSSLESAKPHYCCSLCLKLLAPQRALRQLDHHGCDHF